jgi:hypothetical protein
MASISKADLGLPLPISILFQAALIPDSDFMAGELAS